MSQFTSLLDQTDLTSVKSQIPKALTGISGFDEITFGGLPAGRPTLVCGSAGCGKTLFGMTFLIKGAMEFDEPGVLMTFEREEGRSGQKRVVPWL